MATIYQNIFAGTEGGPWPDFTPVEGSHGLTSGKGRQATTAAVDSRAKAYYNVPGIPQDFVLTVDVTIAAGTTNDWYLALAVRGGSNSFNNLWLFSSWEILYKPAIGGVQLYNVNGAGANGFLTSFSHPACVVGDTLHLKIAPLGTTFRIKSWKNAASEPASYETFVDAGAPTGTRVMLGCQQGLTAIPALDIRWDDLLIVDTVTAVTGTVARTLGGVTSAAAGGGAVGTLARTLQNELIAASGGSSTVGSLAETLDNAVVQSVGGVGAIGTVAKTLGNATVVAVGASGGTAVTGTLAVALEGVEVGSPLTDDLGNPILDGIASPILDEFGNPILDELGNPILGTAGGNPILVRGAEGTHGLAGSGLFVTLDNVLIAASGSTGGGTGSLAETLDPVTVVASGSQGVPGSLAETLANATVVATGTVGTTGSLARTLANTTCVASGTSTPAGVAGNLVETLDNAVVAAGGSSTAGTVAETLDALTCVAEGTASAEPVTGIADIILADITSTSEGFPGAVGTLARTLSPVECDAVGAGNAGTVNETLDDLVLVSAGSGSVTDFQAVTFRERGHAVSVRDWN